jgi:putative ATP-dependent endonuclease of OLD family
MQILLDTVRISNFRSLKNVEIKLSPLTLLVGMNNAGKTTFLRALQIALGTTKNYVSTDDFFEEGKPILIDIKITSVDNNFNRINIFADDSWSSVFRKNIQTDENGEYFAFRTIISFDEQEKEYKIEKFTINQWLENGWEEEETYNDSLDIPLSQLPFYFIDAQRDIVDDLRNKSSYLGQTLSKIKFNPDRIASIQTQINSLNNEIIGSHPIFENLQQTLNKLTGTINGATESITLAPIAKKVRDLNKSVDIDFKDNETHQGFPLAHHGMGTRSWASLLTFDAFVDAVATISAENDKPFFPILALEEPEAHLHPNAQRQIYAQLTKLQGQKIISTHSPYIAGQAKLEELRHFYKTDAATEINQLTKILADSEIKRKVSREVIHSQGELLFAKMIITHEGESEALALPIFIEEYFGKTISAMGIVLASGNGNNHKPFLMLANDLKIKWALFSDFDNDNIIKGVNNAILAIELDINSAYPNIIKLGYGLEKYLINQGYEIELKKGIAAFAMEIAIDRDERNLASIGRRIMAYSVFQLEADLIEKEVTDTTNNQKVQPTIDKGKTKYPPFYAGEIIKAQDISRRFPTAILQLLKEISIQLNEKPQEDYAAL